MNLDKTRHLPVVTSSPHVRSTDSIRSIMLDVLIALFPALLVGVFTFGPRALVLTVISVGACLFFEWGYSRLVHKKNPIGDLSAAVTGVLLAFNLPVAVPLWMPVVGALFAIVIVKQLYGGIGKNVFNPALAARVFLFLAWSSAMTTWTPPFTSLSWFGSAADAVTCATPMAVLKEGSTAGLDLMAMLTGQTGGCIGETSALALAAGGVYLLIRRVITPRIPVAYLGTVALLALLFPKAGSGVEWMLYQLLGGGLMLGAIFMATDYTTSPASIGGQWIFGIGCGVITVAIRYCGAYNEGVSFAILLMNAFVWMIDMAFKPRRYGTRRFERLRAKVGKKRTGEREAQK